MILIIFGFLCLIPRASSSISNHNWREGVESCINEESCRRPATLGDALLLQKDTWVYCVRFQLSTGGSIIIQSRRTEEEITELKYGNVYVKSFGGKNNCEPKNCTLCEDDIVFTKNRSTLETGRQRMIPGKQYTLYDESFEDYPNPDECMMYNADDKKFVFRNCSESQGVQCVNETYDHYAVKACFQENPDGFSCIPEMKDQKKLIKTEFPIPNLCLRKHVCEIILLGGVLFLYAIIIFICIMCCTKYQVRRILKKRNGDFVEDPKTQIYTYTYKRGGQENWTVQETVEWASSFKQTSV